MLRRLAHRWRNYMTVGTMLLLQDVRAEQDALRYGLEDKLAHMRNELAAARADIAAARHELATANAEIMAQRLGLEALKTTHAERTRELTRSMEDALATLMTH